MDWVAHLSDGCFLYLTAESVEEADRRAASAARIWPECGPVVKLEPVIAPEPASSQGRAVALDEESAC